MKDISSHEKILQLFHQLFLRKNLHHAYCLVGPKYTNKRDLAFSLAVMLLQVPKETIAFNANFLLIQQEINEKTSKTKRDIDIEQIKSLRQFSLQQPLGAEYKVVIIDEAEKLNTHSSNALLKTLEEPKGKTIFFLLTNNESELLPTIRSRCQMLFVTSEEVTVYEDEIVDRYISLFGQTLSQKMKTIEYLFGDKTDHIAARENLVGILDAWEVVTRDFLLKSLGHEKKCVHTIKSEHIYSPEIFLQINTKILEAKKYLLQNIHPKLLVEQILLQIP